MDTIDLADFERLLRGNPGLIIGPGQRVDPDHCSDIQTFLKDKHPTDEYSLHAIVDSIIASKGVNEGELRRAVANAVKSAVPAPQLAQLAATAGDKVIFKDGTSLSKGWNLIQRFSEDIDIFLDPLAFQPELRKKGIDRDLKKLRDAVAAHPALTCQRLVDAKWADPGPSRHRFQIE